MKSKVFLLSCIVIIFCGCEQFSKEMVDEVAIYGNIIDVTTGLPLYNANVAFYDKNGYNIGSTVTGNDGNYEFTLSLEENVSDAYFINASKDKYQSSTIELKESSLGNNKRVKIDFQLTCQVIFYEGVVIDSKGNPIVDAHLSAGLHYYTYQPFGNTVITDSTGSYSLILSKPKNEDQWQIKITASKKGYADTEHTLIHNADDMGKIVTLNFTLKSDEEIEQENEEEKLKSQVTFKGKVLKNQQPAVGLYIEHWIGYSSTHYYRLKSNVQTDINGEYEIHAYPTYSDGYYDFNNFKYKDGDKVKYNSIQLSDNDAGKTFTLPTITF